MEEDSNVVHLHFPKRHEVNIVETEQRRTLISALLIQAERYWVTQLCTEPVAPTSNVIPFKPRK